MAARPRTLPAAIAPVLVGTRRGGRGLATNCWVGAFVAALIGSIFIQIGTNLANDYSDAKRGADTADRLGPVRVTSSGLVAPRRVLYATWLAFAVAVVAGIYLATVAGPVILAVGVALDRRRRPLHRRPAPLRLRRAWASCSSSSSSAWSPSTAPTTSSSRSSTALPFWLSISVGLLSTAILVVNNIRDIETDRRAGKRTLAVRLGASGRGSSTDAWSAAPSPSSPSA